MRLINFFLAVALSTSAFSQKTDPVTNEGGEIPPKTYIKSLINESDLALKVKVKSVNLDSCKTCTSTGVLYVIECDILEKYIDKKKSITEDRLYYLSTADTSLYTKSKEIIVFLNPIEKQNTEKFKSVSWVASQATEFIYTSETESYIIKKPIKKPIKK